jgi:23S rRNA maturation-related 3'-5' exoribonuclease YhaM
VDGLKSAKEVSGTLFINHEGTKQVRERRIRALESEVNRFVIEEDESPQDMYNRLNKIINKIKSLGSTRWGRREVVD